MKFVFHNNQMINADTLFKQHYEPPLSLISLSPKEWATDIWAFLAEKCHDIVMNLQEGFYGFVGWSFTELTSIITKIPTSVIINSSTVNLSKLFAIYGIVMMGILTLVEGGKALFGFKYTNPGAMFGRVFIGLVGAGMTIPALAWLAGGVNFITQNIMDFGQRIFGSINNEALGNTFHAETGIAMIIAPIFMVLFGIFMIKACLKAGERWFQLILNIIASPFAWASYTTEGTTKYLTAWLNSTGKILLVHVVYAFYTLIITSLVAFPTNGHTVKELFIRILIAFGGLQGLAKLPPLLRNMDVDGDALRTARNWKALSLFKRGAKS